MYLCISLLKSILFLNSTILTFSPRRIDSNYLIRNPDLTETEQRQFKHDKLKVNIQKITIIDRKHHKMLHSLDSVLPTILIKVVLLKSNTTFIAWSNIHESPHLFRVINHQRIGWKLFPFIIHYSIICKLF